MSDSKAAPPPRLVLAGNLHDRVADVPAPASAVKLAFSVLNMPDGGWHYVVRIWEHGPHAACTIHPAKERYSSAARAFGAALDFADKRVASL